MIALYKNTNFERSPGIWVNHLKKLLQMGAEKGNFGGQFTAYTSASESEQ